MCGIAGIYSGENFPGREKAVAEMTAALSHRGPDNEGSFHDEAVSLGHRRLSILDLSEAGRQPMHSDDGRYVIIHNGEIYNFRELKEELRGYPFRTTTDTEVILAAYRKWGSACAEHLNGIFAFAVWDRERKKLFIARDRMGVKPLYYYLREGKLVFASEMRALLKSGLVPALADASSLAFYMQYQTVQSPSTILSGVKMLEAGSFLEADQEGIKTAIYWKPVQFINSAPAKKNYEEIKHDIRELLRNSVKRQLVSDVPFGAFLSGGIDSTAVVGLMSEVSSVPVKTFTVVFDEMQFSEAHYAKIVAEKFGTEHTEIKLSAKDFLKSLPDALSAMDHPTGDGPNSFIVCRATKEAGVTMALSGLGGDEVFAGYEIFRLLSRFHKLKILSAVPSPLRALSGKIISSLSGSSRSGKAARILSTKKLNEDSFYAEYRRVFSTGALKRMYAKGFDENILRNAVMNSYFENSADGNFLSVISLAEMRSYMHDVLLRDTDQMSMAHALEVRVPLLDHELAEYVLAVPDMFKGMGSPKKLLVDSLGGMIPEEIYNRRKMGFTFPWEEWIRNDLNAFCREHYMSVAGLDCFDKKEFEKRWAGFCKGERGISWNMIWHIAVLGFWMNHNKVKL